MQTELVTAATSPRLPPVEAGPSPFERALLVGLGASFHVLATPRVAGVELRLGLSDLLLAVAFVWAVRLQFGHGLSQLERPIRRSFLWLSAMFALLAAAYLLPGIHSDMAAVWARLKLVGFVVLSGYFVTGSLFGRLRGMGGLRASAQGFVAGAWVSAALGIVEYGAYLHFDYPITWVPRIAALAENPNTFAIMLAAALVIDVAVADRPLFGQRLRDIGTAVVLLAVFLAASRTAYGSLAVGLAALVLLAGTRPRRLVRQGALAVVLFAVLFSLPPLVAPMATGVLDRFVSGSVAGGGAATRPARPQPPKETFAVAREQVDIGVRVRLEVAQQAAMMWWQHPWFGAGLGAFWRSQIARDVAYPYLNHNTTLWLASETGLLGLSLFMGGVLWTTARFVALSRQLAFAAALLGMMCVMLTASMGMEVSYQRYVWYFVGLMLGALAGRTVDGRTGQE